jgi:hypothetical protein
MEVPPLRLLVLTIFALGMTGCAQCGGSSTAPDDPLNSQAAPAALEPRGSSGKGPSLPGKSAKLQRPVRSGDHPAGTTGADLLAKAERKSHPSLKALRVASRKLVISDRAIVANQLGYQQAVEKTRRQIKELDLERRMPPEPLTAEALRPRIEALVRQSRLELVDLKVGSQSATRAIPTSHLGPGPYQYHPDQLIGQQPVSITVSPANDTNASALFERLKALPAPFIDVNAVMVTGNGKSLILSGVIPMLRTVDPPVQIVQTPSLSELARRTGVEIPSGDYPILDIQRTLDEHHELLGDLKKSMVLLAKTHLLGLQLRFARQRIEANKQRPFPTPMGRLGPGLQKIP